MNFAHYVSATNGRARALVSGPYPSHALALADVARVNAAVCARDPRAHFYGWGTARVTVPDGEPLRAGVANGALPALAGPTVGGYVIAP